jgi:Ca2+-binding RTX toxin-like protein
MTGERVVDALDRMQRELEQNKSRIDSDDLEQYARDFKGHVLDTAGLFDVVNFGQGIGVGDISIDWEGDDLLLRLQDGTDSAASDGDPTGSPGTDTPQMVWDPVTQSYIPISDDDNLNNNTAGDVLRLQEWGQAAAYIERFDFTGGQVDAAGINQWTGGGDDDDQLTGTSGHDWITGAAGNDTIAAGAGDDILNGNSGEDILQGDGGDDLINGGDGSDQLFGGSGDDLINGGEGDDLLDGGAGADQFDGGDGIDKVSYSDADAGVRVYLDNGASLEIDHGLSGEIHERTLGDGTSAERDALIKQLLEILPDPDELIQDIADTVPWAETLELPFSEAVATGQRDTAIELLQTIYDGSTEILLKEERSALLEAIDLVTLEPLPAETELPTFWDQVVVGLPDRGELIERIADLVPSREEQGEKIAAFIIQGNRTALVNAINSWLSPLFGETAQAKADEILALIPEQLPAIRGSVSNLATATDVIESTDAYASFTSTGLDYGPEEKDTLGSFLRSDGSSLAEEQRVGPFNNLAVKLSGYIYLEKGRHDFTVTSDDGFELNIGGTTLTTKSDKEVRADFESGFYHFDLTYFDHKGDEELSITSESLADGHALDSSFFYTDPLQVDPRLSEQSDANGRSYLGYPDTHEQGDYYVNVEGAIGSAHDDLLWGDAADNLLIGGDGDDSLRGGGGNDHLQGGAGNDSYEFGRGDGQDVIEDSAGEDFLMLGEEITPEQLWLARVGDALELSVIGSNDKLTITDWYSDPGCHIEAITTQEGLTLLDNQMESLVQAMSAFSPPTMGDATFGLSQEDQNTISGLIAASWQ